MISGTKMTDRLEELDNEDELREQIDALLRGTIEPGDFQQLQNRPKSDPSVRQLYLAELEVESRLSREHNIPQRTNQTQR